MKLSYQPRPKGKAGKPPLKALSAEKPIFPNSGGNTGILIARPEKAMPFQGLFLYYCD